MIVPAAAIPRVVLEKRVDCVLDWGRVVLAMAPSPKRGARLKTATPEVLHHLGI
jgi:hypothetical protein